MRRLILLLILSSCSVTFNKSDFKKFKTSENQNNLIKINGYYFNEITDYKYSNFVSFGTGERPTDSLLIKKITGIIFYEDSKVYVMMNSFDGLEHTKSNSLKVAQEKLLKRVKNLNLKNNK